MSNYPTGLDSGVRDIVYALIDAGFRTTDSGDGSKVGWMEDALPFPHVVAMSSPESMVEDAHRMLSHLPDGWVVEATYSTEDGYCTLFARESGGQWHASAEEIICAHQGVCDCPGESGGQDE